MQRRHCYNTKQWMKHNSQRNRIHTVTVTSFCSVSMPVDFCRHLVGKNSEKVCHCHSALLVSQWSYAHFLKLVQFYLNDTINLRHLTRRKISCYTHKMAIVLWPQTLWRHFNLYIHSVCILSRLHLATGSTRKPVAKRIFAFNANQ